MFFCRIATGIETSPGKLLFSDITRTISSYHSGCSEISSSPIRTMLSTRCQGVIFVIAFSINPITPTGVFYKLVGKVNDKEVKDERVPLLSKPFFTCALKNDCDEVAKNKDNGQFKEVSGQDTIGENDVVYRKIKLPKVIGENISKLLNIITLLNDYYSN